MALPTYSWNDITQSQTDPESPIDTTLMEGLRQNLVHLREWLGSGFTAAIDHDHDGINSKSVLLADSVVTLAKLKLIQGSYSQNTAGTVYINVSQYSHLPHTSLVVNNGAFDFITENITMGNSPGSYRHVKLTLNGAGEGSATVYWDLHSN